MSFFIHSIRKDLARLRRDPIKVVVWVGIPLLIGGLLSLMTGGADGPKPKAKVLLVDQDQSALSGLLTNLAAGAGGAMLELEEVALEAGRARLDAGGATAMLIIPEGFVAAILAERPTSLQLVTNPAQRILPGIVEEGLEIAVDATFYAHRLLGEPLQQILAASSVPGSPDDATVAAVSVRVNQVFQSLQGVLLPPILQLEHEVVESELAAINFGAIFLPGMLIMSLLFIAQGMSGDIWKEKELGTLRRAASAPVTLAGLLAGKLLASAVVMVVVAILGAVIGSAFYGMPLIRLPAAVVWSTLAGGALLALFQLLQVYSSSQIAGNTLSTIAMFPLMMLGGSFFPFEAMPGWMRSIGAWTPNGLAVNRLKELMFGTIDPASLATAAGTITLIAAAALALSVRRLRTSFITD